MKIRVPDYYKDFKCIAGACKDTCCAGWEVDVDEDSYQSYRSVKGSLGQRLQDVMIPKEEGEGCSFRLTPDKRCPFLDVNNLCDIYSELGEDALCETCTNFPRFVHDYGAVREIGPAPSCFTAAQLMVNKEGETALETHEDASVFVTPNDIEPEVFFFLKGFREEVFRVLWSSETDLDMPDRLIKILELAADGQEKISEMGDFYNSDEGGCAAADAEEDIISAWLAPFPGMEVINEDWRALLDEHDKLRKAASDSDELKKIYKAFEANVTFAEEALRQLVFYYLYRYVLEAVYDGRLLCAVKTAVVAYLSVKRLCVARFFAGGKLSRDEMADIFHLYSRQIEHSDTNFEHYRDEYDNREVYSIQAIKGLLAS